MRRLFAILVIGVSALSTFPAWAELEDFSDWKSRAYYCGYNYQYALGRGSVQYAFPEWYTLKDAILAEARHRGASPEQLQVIDKEFEAGRTWALDEGREETTLPRELLESWDETRKQEYRDIQLKFFAFCTMNNDEIAE